MPSAGKSCATVNEIQAVEKLAGTPSLHALTLYRPTPPSLPPPPPNQRRESNTTPLLQNLVEDLYPRNRFC